MAGNATHRAVRLAAALVPLLLVLAPVGRAAGQVNKNSTETRTYTFEMVVITNELAGCTTTWNLRLTNDATYTDPGTPPTRGPVSISASVFRRNATFDQFCPKPVQISLLSGTSSYPFSPSMSKFEVSSNASYITVKGATPATLNWNYIPTGQIGGNLNAAFNIDAACTQPQNPAIKTSSTVTTNGTKVTTTTTKADCAGSLVPPDYTMGTAFNPSGMIAIKFSDDVVLDWSTVTLLQQVTFRYASTKVTYMGFHRRMLRA